MILVTPGHAAALAAIHAASFPAAQRWHPAAMAELLAMPGVFGFVEPAGAFILAREAGGEAEILTLTTAPGARRRGLARGLLAATLAQAGSVPVFLEVAAGNAPAVALYGGAGFVRCGTRRDYYAPGQDAWVMRRQPF